MRTLHVKPPVRGGSARGYSTGKREQKTAVHARHGAERRGLRGGEDLGDGLVAGAQVEHVLEPRPGNQSRASVKQGFEQRLEAQLKEWDAKLKKLKARARNAKAEIGAEFEVQLEDLAGERAVAQEKLQELRRHGEWAWEDLKDSAEEAWSELREAIERSASLLK